MLELVVSSSVPVSVRSIYLSVDWTVVVAHCVDPEQNKTLFRPLAASQHDKPVVGLWKDWSRREGGPTSVSPHEVLQLPELVLQFDLALGQGLHYGGVVGPHVRDWAGVQIVRA